MSHCLSVSLVNRQRPRIQTAYCYCALAALCISQMFPHLGTQEVNSKQRRHTQEVGTGPAGKEPVQRGEGAAGQSEPLAETHAHALI